MGSTYSMERTLPTGRAENELEIVAREPRRGPIAVRAVKRGVDDNLAALKRLLEVAHV